jgi:hypothetical protein
VSLSYDSREYFFHQKIQNLTAVGHDLGPSKPRTMLHLEALHFGSVEPAAIAQQGFARRPWFHRDAGTDTGFRARAARVLRTGNPIRAGFSIGG